MTLAFIRVAKPQDFLEGMTNEAAEQRRVTFWASVLSQEPDEQGLILVAEQEGQVIAFASAGPARDHEGYEAELLCLYCLKSAQGLGIGKALLQAVTKQLKASGKENMALWVLAQNPTREWYKRQGAQEAGQKTEAIKGGELSEIRMVWNNLVWNNLGTLL